MNATRDTENLKLCLRSKAIDMRLFNLAEGAPVFEFNSWTRITKDELNWLCQNNVVERTAQSLIPQWSPFPVFRLYGTGGWIQCWHDKKEGTWHIIRWLDWIAIIKEHKLTPSYSVDGICYMQLSCFPNYRWNGNAHIYATGGIAAYTSGSTPDAVKPLADETWQTIVAFCCHTALPHTTVVQVRPKGGEHKSVKWHKARTHYLLLTHMQAQHLQKTRRPATQQDIERAAHWRRAHFRRLNSPRFTYRRGAVVPVQRAWVGPKEWEGTDAKIYKVWEVEKPQ